MNLNTTIAERRMIPKHVMVISSMVLIGFLALLAINTDDADASSSSNSGRYALIAVSTLPEDDCGEVLKAHCLYEHLLDDGWEADEIYYLSPEYSSVSEGIANVSNVNNGFKFLEENTDNHDDVLIYISDHTTLNDGMTTFQFSDGNMSSDLINIHLDIMKHDELTFIMCGNQSGLAGGPLAANGRDIVCSMGEADRFNPDEYNLTRGLNDPFADMNNDGTVSFIEASEREISTMAEYTPQTPRIWYG